MRSACAFLAACALAAPVLLGCGVDGASTETAATEPTPSVAPAGPPSVARLIEQLTREFEGSYPREAPGGGKLREFELTAAPTEVEIFDGRKLKVWSYNGQVPGPTLRVRIGDTVRVVLHNRLPMPTTIHWHGVRVPNEMDGVPEVTQAPVPPGASFTYEFKPKDAGTFWFHPHVRSHEQVERGLYGVLVVEDARPPAYSRDLVWVLDDWRLTQDGKEIDPNFVTRSDLMHDGRWGRTMTVNGQLNHVLDVKAGERIRLRMLNSANGRVFVPDMWRFDAKLIAVDGKPVERPYMPKRFEMAPGNRLDFDIRFRAEDAGRLIPIRDAWSRDAYVLASIRVLDEVVPTPQFPLPTAEHMPAWKWGETVPHTLEYVLNNRVGGPQGIQWTLNDVAYAPHNEREVLYRDEWVKIRFTNLSSRLHPMHIHGVFFKVLSRNGRPLNEGFWRDTVLTRPRETVEIGLVPLDLGAWMLHCHILEHASSGMMTIVEVKQRDGINDEDR